MGVARECQPGQSLGGLHAQRARTAEYADLNTERQCSAGAARGVVSAEQTCDRQLRVCCVFGFVRDEREGGGWPGQGEEGREPESKTNKDPTR